MYNNLTLYYLKQMGVRPWIKKEEVLPSNQPLVASKKLLIFSLPNLSIKAQILLQQIVTYLDLPTSELEVITSSHYTKKEEPLAILSLGGDIKPADQFSLLKPCHLPNLYYPPAALGILQSLQFVLEF